MGYNPNQPRDPAGEPTGGQWTSAQLNTIDRAARKAAGIVSFGEGNKEAVKFISKETGAKIMRDNNAEFDPVLGYTQNYIFEGKLSAVVQTSIRETEKEVFLNSIAVKTLSDLSERAHGTGRGLTVLNAIKKYVDKSKKKFIVPDSTKKALSSWGSIPWLSRDYGVYISFGGRKYNPPNTFSYTPTH